MRKFATVLSLFALCLASASAQSWNLAQDPAATLASQTTVLYEAYKTSSGLEITLKAGERETITDEVSIWRTGTGSTNYTVSDIAVYDPTLTSLPKGTAIEAQCKAAVLKGIADKLHIRQSTEVEKTKVWYSENGTAYSMNFEIRWDAAGTATVTRLPDDAPTATVN